MLIGTYEVICELGRGGMGAVFLARSAGPMGVQRLVAIKRPHVQRAELKDVSERFLEEARITAKVHHANVVSMHQAGVDEEGYYLVFDYVEGESLGELADRARARGERIPEAIVFRIVLDALAGLHAAHETRGDDGTPLGILHRDVSPQNLLVGRDGVTRLTDFGIAKSTASSVVTDQRYVRGKFVFMAPEYLQRLPVDRTLDVYAMGVTLWCGVQCAPPWEGFEEAQLMQAILLDGVPPAPLAAPALAELIATACSRDAGHRFQTARKMLDALEAVRTGLGAVASHIDVAEYMERIAGADLDRRRELAARPATRSAASRSTDPGPLSGGATTEMHWQSAEHEPAPILPTTEVRRVYEGRSPWWTVGSILLAVGVAGVAFAVMERGTPPPAPDSGTVAPAGKAAAQEPPPASASAAPQLVPEPLVVPVEAGAATAVEEEPPPRTTPKSGAGGARKPSRRERSNGPSGFLPFSPKNPYK